ncbi:PAS domain S-box protein [Ramlibacter sp. WS9]|uniref:PAS domain S-box protein n=1 Tax=Ramlibacter sp. WS9 TaxID=1882741 RepID=UPI001141A7DC|nr:PAS domain S-box protein [Ramlibacter sp. WS9]ROZ77132.1 PAS domain S-box protein [Ramlibacter sp. WS9]
MAAKQSQEALPRAPGPQSAQTSEPARALARTPDATAEHRRTELELELEQHWRATFEANPTMYFIVDNAGTIVSVNPFGAQQLGYAVSELVGQPVLNVFHAGDRAFVQKQAETCFANLGRPLRWEARKLRRDGSMLWVREIANAVMLRSHPVLLVACEDVTEQKRTEAALRESEERFRTLVQFSFDVYWESDAQHRFVRQEFDLAVPTEWPVPGSELGKTRWEVPYLEPDEEAWRKHREALDAHLPFRDFELARPTAEGGKRYVAVSGLPVFDDAGAFVGYRGVGRNITERKRAEEMLRQREQEVRDIIETMPAMAFVTDASGRNAMGNRRWHEYTGLGPAAANSKEAVHPDDAGRYRAARRHSIATGEPFEQEVRLRRHDGEYRWFLGRAVPLRDEQGNVLKWYGVHTDIHDRKVAEEERAAHLWLLESLDRINRAMQGTNDLERMMSDVLDAVLEVFACDRAWLVYPCDPDAECWRAVMEHTQPQYAGAFALDADVPVDAEMADVFRRAGAVDGAVLFGPGCGVPVPAPVSERFGVRSQMVMAVRPKVRSAYLFGLHQCSHARVWSEQERRLFEEVGRRLDDALTSLLIFRSLRESEQKLEEAQRIGHMGYFELDVRNQRMRLSDEACRIHGLDQNALAPWQGRVIDLVHPGDRVRLAQTFAAAGNGDGRFDLEFRALRVNGEVRIVHSRGEATRDPAGGALRAFGTLQDVTELRRAQEELSASEQLNRHIFESAPDAMAVIGRDYRYRRLNPVYERNWKMPAEKIVGLHVRDLHGTEVFEQILKPGMDRCFAGEQVSLTEWFTTASGRFYYSVIYTPLRLDSEHVEAALAITRDLTAHKLAAEALRDAEAAVARVNRVATLGVLAASIAHEVNQPLGAITASAAACTRWLAAQPPEMEKARSALQRIVADGRRAGQVVDRIRALVNRQAPRTDRVDVNAAILEVIALMRDEVRRNAISLDTSLALDLPPIEGDRVQLQQVVLNLLVNAIDAMRANGAKRREIAIASIRDDANTVTVEVRDSGPGVDPAQMERLFEAFYSTKEGGIGMGLSISRSIIEAHGGRLWVAPNGPRGAAFRFSLPALHQVA